MATIFNVPPEVLAKEMVQYLPNQETGNFSLVSRGTHQIVLRALNFPQEDKTLDGERRTINLFESSDGTIASLRLQKLKMEVLDLPEFPRVVLKEFRRLVKKTDNLVILLAHVYNYANLPNYINPDIDDDDFHDQLACDMDKRILALTPFDFFTKKISGVEPHRLPEGEPTRYLYNALDSALDLKSKALVRAVLSHPNAAKISAEDLGKALERAVRLECPEIVSVILSHPNALNIPVEGQLSLRKALAIAIAKNNQEIAGMISAFLDRSVLLQIKDVLGSEGCFSISMRLRDLSKETRDRVDALLCQTYGKPTGYIALDSFGHILQNPQSLLPIINQLI